MTTDTVGGVWHYSLDLARGLAARGTRVELAALGAEPSPEQRAAAARVPGLALHPFPCKLEWMREPWAEVAAAGEFLLALELRCAPDLIHLNQYAHGALPWRAPRFIVGHSCVLSWWRAVRGSDAPAGWDRYRAAVRAGLAAADYVIAPSRTMLAALERHYGPLPPCAVIGNGRDPGRFAPAAKEPHVLAAGRLWDEGKNMATAAAAAREMVWPLRIAGGRHHPDGGEVHFEKVELLGELGEAAMAAACARAAIFLHPALYEPFGLSVVEAALAGCALVLADIPSLRELWEGAALFVPPRQAGAMAEAVNRLAREPLRREQLAHRARRRARRYRLEQTVNAYDTLYRALAGGPGRRAPRHKEI